MERDSRVSEERANRSTSEVENKYSKETREFGKQGANRSKETRECRKRLETLKTRGKLLERNQRIFTKRSKPLERD